jgi:multiple sugar transport system permease protein
MAIAQTSVSRRRTERMITNLVLLLVAACFALPLLWLVLASLNGHAGLRLSNPHPWTFGNFRDILNTDTTYRPMLNSLVLCGGATALCVVCAVLAAYPLSRYRSRLRRPFLLTVLFSTGLPVTAIMVPVYGMFVQVNLIDTVYGTIYFLAASALPFAIWLMKNFMDGVPMVLEEAAWTDGASPMQALRRVIIPLMWPGVMVVTIYTFIAMWGNFFVPFILLLSPDQLPASVSIFNFFSGRGTVQYGQLAAFSVLYSVPVVVLYVVMSRRLGGGFALGGALKG